MELSVTQENLSKALNITSRVASSRTQLPILNNILLRTDGNRLLVAATNLEIATTEYIGAKIITQGAITIPARLITEFITSLPKDTVELKAVNNHLDITCGKYHSVINGIEADDFPELPTIDEKTSVRYSINANDFKTSVSQTIFSTSNDTTRPILTGVYWHSSDGYLFLASTDGYRLAEKKLVETKSEVSAIIPTQSLQEVLRSLSDETDSIDILFDETQVQFRINEIEIVSRLIDGKFPNYKQLIPSSSETNIILNKDEFSRVIKVAGLFSRDSGGSITITADKDTEILSIHSVASELGENTSEIQGSIDNSGQITLNSRYLSEALNAFSSEEIIFSFSGKLSPCVIRPNIKDADYCHIVMPLKS